MRGAGSGRRKGLAGRRRVLLQRRRSDDPSRLRVGTAAGAAAAATASPVVHASLVRVHHKRLVDGDVVAGLGPAGRPARRGVGEPRVSGVLVPGFLERVDLGPLPAAHGEALAPVRDGLVGRLALVAHEGPELDTDRGESELLELPAVGADRVGGEPRQLPDLLFGGGEIGHGSR